MEKRKKESGFIKQVILLLILVAIIFFGYNAYKNIKDNSLNKEGIKEGVIKTIEEGRDNVEVKTDQMIEDSKKSLAEKFKEKVGDIIDGMFGIEKEKNISE